MPTVSDNVLVNSQAFPARRISLLVALGLLLGCQGEPTTGPEGVPVLDGRCSNICQFEPQDCFPGVDIGHPTHGVCPP